MPRLLDPAHERLAVDLDYTVCIGVLNPVVAVTRRVIVRVEARPAEQRIIAPAASQGVSSGIAHQQIGLTTAGQGIRAMAAQHEGPTVLKVRRIHPTRPRLYVPVPQHRSSPCCPIH